MLESARLEAVPGAADPRQLLCSRYMLHRSKLIKALVVGYILFNTQVAFPRVLRGMTDAAVCTMPFVLRYINAQPLLTSCLTTMVCSSSQACALIAIPGDALEMLMP